MKKNAPRPSEVFFSLPVLVNRRTLLVRSAGIGQRAEVFAGYPHAEMREDAAPFAFVVARQASAGDFLFRLPRERKNGCKLGLFLPPSWVSFFLRSRPGSRVEASSSLLYGNSFQVLPWFISSTQIEEQIAAFAFSFILSSFPFRPRSERPSFFFFNPILPVAYSRIFIVAPSLIFPPLPPWIAKVVKHADFFPIHLLVDVSETDFFSPSPRLK